jgi:hypothetical protein
MCWHIGNNEWLKRQSIQFQKENIANYGLIIKIKDNWVDKLIRKSFINIKIVIDKLSSDHEI